MSPTNSIKREKFVIYDALLSYSNSVLAFIPKFVFVMSIILKQSTRMNWLK